MRAFFPGPGGVPAWYKAALGRNPFPFDERGGSAAFFRPASRLCRRAVPAEKGLPAAIPSALRVKIAMSLRAWQASQEITADFIFRGKLQPGMDMPMTLNFAMALGNYSRASLFCGDELLTARTAAALHAAFTKEMIEMPAAMAVLRSLKEKRLSAKETLFAGRYSPSASAMRLAAACAGALKERRS